MGRGSAIDTWIKKNALTIYFVLAYGLSWAIEIPIALSVQGIWQAKIPLAIHYLASFGPLLAALIVTTVTEGSAGLKRLFSGFLKWRVGFGYVAFSVLAPFALFMLAVLVARVLQGTWPDLRLLGKVDYLPYIGIPGALGLWLLTYGLGEETGWRGFALPHLQRKRTAGSSALILGVLWAFWHLPAFFYRPTYAEMGILFGFPMFLVSILFVSAVFVWLYNSTQGSLLMVTLFHAIFNWLSVSNAGGQYAAFIMSVPVILWAVFVMRRYGPLNAAPVQRQIA